MAEEEHQTSKQHVEKWLRENGVALEMSVATQFERGLGVNSATAFSMVEHSFTYVGSHVNESGDPKTREIDVLARVTHTRHFGGPEMSIWLPIECKSSKQAEWLFYKPKPPQHTMMSLESIGWDVDFGGGAQREGLLLAPGTELFHPNREAAYAVATTTAKGKNECRDAISQAISAGKGLGYDIEGSSLGGSYVAVIVPVVVTAAPMYTVIAGDIKPVTDTTDCELVRLPYDASGRRAAAWVVHQDAVDQFVLSVGVAANNLNYRR